MKIFAISLIITGFLFLVYAFVQPGITDPFTFQYERFEQVTQELGRIEKLVGSALDGDDNLLMEEVFRPSFRSLNKNLKWITPERSDHRFIRHPWFYPGIILFSFGLGVFFGTRKMPKTRDTSEKNSEVREGKSPRRCEGEDVLGLTLTEQEHSVDD